MDDLKRTLEVILRELREATPTSIHASWRADAVIASLREHGYEITSNSGMTIREYALSRGLADTYVRKAMGPDGLFRPAWMPGGRIDPIVVDQVRTDRRLAMQDSGTYESSGVTEARVMISRALRLLAKPAEHVAVVEALCVAKDALGPPT